MLRRGEKKRKPTSDLRFSLSTDSVTGGKL